MYITLAQLGINIVKYGIPLVIGHFGGAAAIEFGIEKLQDRIEELEHHGSQCRDKRSYFLKEEAGRHGLENLVEDSGTAKGSEQEEDVLEKIKNTAKKINQGYQEVKGVVSQELSYTPCAHEKRSTPFGRQFKGFFLSRLPENTLRRWFDECELRRREAQLAWLSNKQDLLEKIWVIYDRSATRVPNKAIN